MAEDSSTGQATPSGGAAGDIHVAGGAAADTMVPGPGSKAASAGLVAGAVTLMSSRGGTDEDGPTPAAFIFTPGNSSVAAAARLDAVHVVGGQAGGADPDGGVRIEVTNVHLVDFASTVSAGGVTPSDGDAPSDPPQSPGGPQIDMVGLGPMTQNAVG